MGLAHAASLSICCAAYLVSAAVLGPIFGTLGFAYAAASMCVLCGLFMLWGDK